MEILVKQDPLALGSSERMESFDGGIEQFDLKRASRAFPGCRQLLRPGSRLLVKRHKWSIGIDPQPGQQVYENLEGFVSSNPGQRVARLTSFHQQGVVLRFAGEKSNCTLTVPTPQRFRLVFTL